MRHTQEYTDLTPSEASRKIVAIIAHPNGNIIAESVSYEQAHNWYSEFREYQAYRYGFNETPAELIAVSDGYQAVTIQDQKGFDYYFSQFEKED